MGPRFVKKATVESFTTNAGIRLRRRISMPLRWALRRAAKRKIVIERWPDIPPTEPLIFAALHYFDEDILVNIASVDRNAWVLMGTTDQVDHNPLVFAAWLNGMIYVDRQNTQSRKESLLKMQRILEAGSSVLIFPEGGWNNTENLLCQKLFAGPWMLARNTGARVVPVSAYCDYHGKKVYINAGEPMRLANMEKTEALTLLRDEMASLYFEAMLKYAPRVERATLQGDIRWEFMKRRKQEYMTNKWSHDVWDEELTVYADRNADSPAKAREYLEIITPTAKNAWILAPELVRRKEDIRYDFKRFMKANWNRSPERYNY